MKRIKFKETRAGKRVKRIKERFGETRLGRRLHSKPKELFGGSKKRLTEEYLRWFGHDLGRGYDVLSSAVYLSLIIAKNRGLKKRLSVLFGEIRDAKKEFESFKTLAVQREERLLKGRIGFKRKYKAIMNLAEELRERLNIIRKSDLSQEKRELIEALDAANANLLFFEMLLKKYRAKGLSAKPRLEKIETRRFVEDIARTEINSLSENQRIPLSVNIEPGFITTMDRLDFERCIRNVVGNSAEHNPGHHLEINGYINEKDPGFGNLEFLTRKGKPLPERIVKTPGDIYSSTGKPGKGFGTSIVFHLLRRNGHYLEAENTPRGPKFTMTFRIPKKFVKR